MGDPEILKRRLRAAEVNFPDGLAEAILLAAGPLIGALDELAALDLRDVEPFCPASRLPADVER
ncbi:MAG: hypothetical protein E6J71_21835 [Deltaproteobacteria bacterium]|nr:MAG: hypothetical protein E6J81_16730 [Deltaproteobacteria bacterium]TMA53792.1 MAG: hypothetical protein E6J76_03455 [Deltaproteobacteria bacterium]TMA79560.1 MAG: hypothetical protein E6J77_19470 [Deltaproteobacteria bacterium]TMB13978.1 MAG: hypothetical protein E6J71_21835 [Deltaproteobacteria bacterium]